MKQIRLLSLTLTVLMGCHHEPPPEPEPEPEVFTCLDVATRVLLECVRVSDEPCDGVYDAVYRSCHVELKLGNDVHVLDPSYPTSRWLGWVRAPKTETETPKPIEWEY